MTDQNDVRKIALALPETSEDEGHFAFSVNHRGKNKGFAWVWMERVDPKKARIPNPAVLAVRVRDTQEKEMLLATEPEIFFTEPHYNGFPAVLVRLEAVNIDDLIHLLKNAWRCLAPPELVKAMDQSEDPRNGQ
jgi:hypothetical protein